MHEFKSLASHFSSNLQGLSIGAIARIAALRLIELNQETTPRTRGTIAIHPYTRSSLADPTSWIKSALGLWLPQGCYALLDDRLPRTLPSDNLQNAPLFQRSL